MQPPVIRDHLLTALTLGLGLATVARGAQPEAAEPAAAVLDRVVAVVDDRLILASDVALEVEIARREPRGAGGLVWSQGDPLQSLIDAAVIRALAGDVAIYQPSAAEVRARQLALRATFTDPTDYASFLARYGLNEDRLAGVLFAREVVERYVQRNVLIGSEGFRGDPLAMSARFDAWITEARAGVSIRLVTQGSPEPAIFGAP